jgi:hypothetical protein
MYVSIYEDKMQNDRYIREILTDGVNILFTPLCQQLYVEQEQINISTLFRRTKRGKREHKYQNNDMILHSILRYKTIKM